jgi:hypothetical protein
VWQTIAGVIVLALPEKTEELVEGETASNFKVQVLHIRSRALACFSPCFSMWKLRKPVRVDCLSVCLILRL